MISRLQGHRVETTRGNENVNCFISADPDQKKATLLIWNYGAVIPEEGPARDKSVAEKTLIHIRDAADLFHSKQVKVETWQLNENTDNIYRMLTHGVQPSVNNTGMAQLPSATATVNGEILDYSLVLPPSSVSLVVLTSIK
jgi:formylmethanofuran dehydrogenase subunit E-like metal-binding protein